MNAKPLGSPNRSLGATVVKVMYAKPTHLPNPVLRSASLDVVADRIKRAESLDLTTATSEELGAITNDCLRGYTCPRLPLGTLGLRSLYRAVKPNGRVIETVKHIRNPPPECVRAYGRANRPGESVFYGATEIDTALLEMRPEVGDRLVVSEWQPSTLESPEVRELGLLETLDAYVLIWQRSSGHCWYQVVRKASRSTILQSISSFGGSYLSSSQESSRRGQSTNTDFQRVSRKLSCGEPLLVWSMRASHPSSPV